MSWHRILIMGAMPLVLAAVGALFIGQRRWRQKTQAQRASMQVANDAVQWATTTYDHREIANLPAPVQRYFEAVLTDGQPLIRRVHFTQTGLFRQDEHRDVWQPFHATQLVTLSPPGFDWDARIRMGPGIDVWVRDAYVRGAGSLRAAVLGLVSVARVQGTDASARGELMRYLAEAPWYPTALLPSQGVQWEGMDDHAARATLRDGQTSVTLEFRFGDDGLIAQVWAASRPRSETASAPWLCTISAYEEQAGMRVPVQGEVAWQLPGGPEPYFRGRMHQLDYSFAEP